MAADYIGERYFSRGLFLGGFFKDAFGEFTFGWGVLIIF